MSYWYRAGYFTYNDTKVRQSDETEFVPISRRKCGFIPTPAERDREQMMFSNHRTTVAEPNWFYLDKDEKEQGPWSSQQMRSWFLAGFLSLQVKVKQEGEKEFTPIGQRFCCFTCPHPVPVGSVPVGAVGAGTGHLLPAGVMVSSSMAGAGPSASMHDKVPSMNGQSLSGPSVNPAVNDKVDGPSQHVHLGSMSGTPAPYPGYPPFMSYSYPPSYATYGPSPAAGGINPASYATTASFTSRGRFGRQQEERNPMDSYFNFEQWQEAKQNHQQPAKKRKT